MALVSFLNSLWRALMKKLNFLLIILLFFTVSGFARRYVVIVRKTTGGRNKRVVVSAGSGFTAGSKAMSIANRKWGAHHIVVRVYGHRVRRGRRYRARRARRRRYRARRARRVRRRRRGRGAPCWYVRIYNRRTRQKRTVWVAGYSKRKAIYNAKAKARRVMRGWRRHPNRFMKTIWIKRAKCPRTRRQYRKFRR